MNRVFRRLALAATASGAFAACSAAPQEKQAAYVAALDPNQVATPTAYTVTLSSVTVVKAQEPNQGEYFFGTSEVCESNGSAVYWTPDKGFVDEAQLGFRIQSTVPGTIPYNAGNPYSHGCVLGWNQPNGQLSTAANTGMVLTTCAQNTFNDTLAGGPLSVNFTVNSGDQVRLALALDNIEQADVSALSSKATDATATDLKDFGDVAMLTGAVVSTVAPPAGAVIGIVGNGAALLGDVVYVAPAAQCTANSESWWASSCQGGLMGMPTGNVPNVTPFSMPNSTPPSGYTNLPPDTLRIVDPATGGDLTAERLQELTAGGPATFEFTPSYDMTDNSAVMLARNGGVSSWTWTQPTMMRGCASTLKVDVTITRDWTTGLAASAKSVDMAVVRTPGTIDVVSAQYVRPSATATDNEPRIVHHSGEGTSFAAELEAPAAAIQGAGVDFGTAPVVLSRSQSNVDAFWVDDKGGLYTVFEAGASYTWSVKNIVPPGYCVPIAGGRGCNWVPGVLPTDAAMTALAVSPNNLNVFAIGNDGNVYGSWWAKWVGVDSQGMPIWAAPGPVTTGTCANTNGACSGSGAPGGPMASVARNPGQVDAFYIGKDGGVWNVSWNPSAGWVTQEIYGPSSRIQYGTAVAAPGAGITATARTSDNLDVFFVGTDGGLWMSSWSASGVGWATWEIPGTKGAGLPGAPLSAVARQPASLDVVFQGPGASRMNWAYWTKTGGWGLTTIPGAGGLGGSFTPGNVSLVAPTSFGLQLFYLDGFRQPNTMTWSDPTCNTLSEQGCTGSPANLPWSTATVLSPPF